MTPLIYVLMCLAEGPGSLDLTADERFWRDEQSCVVARNNLQKECACVPFVPGSNAGATVTVNTHDATPVVLREKIEDKSKPAAKHERNHEAKTEKPRRRERQALEPLHYQDNRGFGGFGWGAREW